MPEKKRLKTVRVNNRWEMYASEKGHNIAAPDTIFPPKELDIINTENYQKYKDRHLDNIEAAARGENIIKQHNPAYRRKLTAAAVTAVLGLLGIIVAFAKVAVKPPKTNAKAAFTDPVTLTALVAGTVLIISTACLVVSAQRAEDKFNREKEHYNNQRELVDQLLLVNEEIKLKDEVLDEIISLLEENDRIRGANGPLTNNQVKNYFRNNLATAIDSKDDLSVYQSIKENLAKIAGSKYHYILGNRNSELDKLFAVLLVLLISNFSELYYERNTQLFNVNNFKDIITIYELIAIVAQNNFILTGGSITADNFLFKILVEALENHQKLFCLNRLIDWLTILDVNTDIDIRYGKFSIVNIAYNILSSKMDHAKIINNINYMLDDNNSIKQINFVNYMMRINDINDPNILSLAQLLTGEQTQAQINNNFPKFKAIIECMIHTLADDNSLSLALNPQALPKYQF